MGKIHSVSLLRMFLCLIALHSFCVGVALIFMPGYWFGFFGFDTGERFFSTQAGVFHLVVCVAYLMAWHRLQGNESLVLFSIYVKFMAAAFLFLYYLLETRIWMVGFSGLADLIMGIVLWYLFSRYRITSSTH
ncbi:MAG: hypothetical protein JW861_11055 [Bacteroidales bacterium]|nr:hypothetical protein [Bacteroidales bacterium]